MRIFRFLLILAFLSTAFFNSAQAQGMDTETGFIMLRNQADSSVAQRVQIHDAYEKILPILLSGQRNGSILEFQPAFAVGAVKIKFAAGARPAMLGGMRVFENLRDAKDLIPRLSSPGQAVTKAYNPHFEIDVYGVCPFIYGLVADDHVVGSLRDNNGKILAVYEDYADLHGEARYGCFIGNSWALPGHKITYKIYSAAEVLRGTYTVTVPNITFTALNNKNSVARGKGPAGKVYQAFWYHHDLNPANTYQLVDKTGTISVEGNWNVDFGTTKFRGGDALDIYVNQDPRFIFIKNMFVPYSFCYLDTNQCVVYGFSNQEASMAVKHNGTLYTYTGKFDPWEGYFGVFVWDEASLPVFLAAGDVVWGAGGLPYQLPNLAANVNYTTDVISGKAPMYKNFSVCIAYPYDGIYDCRWVHSDKTGDYSVDFGRDLKETDVFFVIVNYINPITGNKTILEQPYGP